MSTENTVRTYLIESESQLFRDTPDRIDYHIRSGDYIPLLATLMGFMEEALRNNDGSAVNREKTAMALKLAGELRQDLRYVSANYVFTPLKENERRSLKSGNVLKP